MTDINFDQMRSLLSELSRNLNNSETGRATNQKLDKIAESLNKVQASLIKSNDLLNDNQGNMDYDKLSAAIISGIGKAMPPSSDKKEDKKADAPGGSGGRNPNSIVGNFLMGLNKGADGIDKASRRAEEAGGKFGGAGRAAANFGKTIKEFDAFKALKSTIDGTINAIGVRTDSYRVMLNNGNAFNGNMLDMAKTIGNSGLSISTFTSAMKNASTGMRMMGTEQFASVTRSIQETNLQFGNLGLSVDEQNTQLSDYSERLRLTGQIQGQTTDSMTSSFRNVIQTSTALAAATGTTRDAFLKAQDDILKNVSNRALLATDGGKAGQNELQIAAMLKQKYGDEVGNKMAHAALLMAHGQGSKAYGELSSQVGGEAMAEMTNLFKQGMTGQDMSASYMARASDSIQQQASRFTNGMSVSGFVGADEAGNGFAHDALAARVAVQSAMQNSGQRAAGVESGMKNQTRFNNAAQNKGQADQNATNTKENAQNAALIETQETLASTMDVYNKGMHDASKATAEFTNSLHGNSLDSAVGNLINKLVELQGPIPTLIEGFLAFKGIGLIQTIKSGKDMINGVMDLFKMFKGGGLKTGLEGAKDLAGRSGILQKLFRGGSSLAEGAETAAGAGETAAGAASVGETAAGAAGIGETAAGAAGVGGAEVAGGGLLAGAGSVAAGVAVPLAAVGYGLWANSKSTEDFKAGKITERENNINHDTNDGLMGGAVTGAATGALIGSIIPGVGTVIGAGVGGLIGAGVGYFGGKEVGKAFNPDEEQKKKEEAARKAKNGQREKSPEEVLLEQILEKMNNMGTMIETFENQRTTSFTNIENNTADTVREIKRSGNAV